MKDPLATYLNDHLSGAELAVHLLKDLSDRESGHASGDLATRLLPEVEEDFETLQKLHERTGGSSGVVKRASALVGQKLTRAKLRLGTPEGMGAFESLETLAVGILGKKGLWTALKELSKTDQRFVETNFDRLIERADDQHARVETCRLALVGKALRPMNSD